MPSELPPPGAPPPPQPPGARGPGIGLPGLPGNGTDPRGGPRRASPLTLVSAAVSAVGGLLLEAVESAATSAAAGGAGRGSFLGLLIVFLVFVNPLFIGVRWFATTYTVDDRTIVVDSGVLQRSRKVVPFARLQQIDVHQKLFDQIIGTATLRMETAGTGADAKVHLGLLTTADAQGLRAFALTRRAALQGGGETAATGAAAGADAGEASEAAPPAPSAAPAERVLLQIGPGRLAVAAVTHHGLLLGGLVFGGIALWSVTVIRLVDRSSDNAAAAITAMGSVIGFAVVFGVVTTIASGVLNRFGFTVAEVGDDLHLRFGLFQVRNLTVPRRRIQQLTIVDNPLRRALGLVSVTLHTAAPGGGAQTAFEIPIADRSAVSALVRELLGRPEWTLPELTPRPPAAERRAVVRRCVAILAVVAVPAVVLQPYGPALVGLALLGMPWGVAAHRRAGYGETAENVAIARGVLEHRIDVLPVRRVQSAQTRSNPFQRRAGVSTLHVDVAGARRSVTLWDVDAAFADAEHRELPRRSGRAA